MGIKHLPDGEDFGPNHFSREFGFHGSAEPAPASRRQAAHRSKLTRDDPGQSPQSLSYDGAPEGDGFARGGHMVSHPDGRMTSHHDDGSYHVVHPDGRVEHHYAMGGHSVTHPDGRIIRFDAMGGHAVHHPDGMIERYDAEGGVERRFPDGRVERHDSSEFVHRARGGGMDASDLAQDKRMIKRAFREHENAEHHGEHETLKLARGGRADTAEHNGEDGYAYGGRVTPGERPVLPRNMKPAAARHKSPIGSGAPSTMPTPRNTFPTGEMGMGVEPSAEPDVAGSDQTPPAMRRGGSYRGSRA